MAVRWDQVSYWALALAPALPYIVLNLSYRRIITRKIAEVESRLTSDIRAQYANAYGDPDIRRALQKFYHWTTYVAPVALTATVAAAFAAISMAVAGVALPRIDGTIASRMAATPLIVIAGAAGAYLWGLDDLVRRHGSADMSSTALHGTWVRMAVAASIGAVLVATKIPTPIGVPLAFAIGSLRISDMWDYVRRRAHLKIDEGKSWHSDLYLVQGLTEAARDRLIAEEIDSVQRLAFADPVRLLFRTNIEWNVILDAVDQAMLINYVGTRIDQLRHLGVRGAIEMAELTSRTEKRKRNTMIEVEHAARMLNLIGAELGQGPDAAYNLSYLLNNDPQVDFIWKNWSTPYGQAEPTPPRRESLLIRVLRFLWSKMHGIRASRDMRDPIVAKAQA